MDNVRPRSRLVANSVGSLSLYANSILSSTKPFRQLSGFSGTTSSGQTLAAVMASPGASPRPVRAPDLCRRVQRECNDAPVLRNPIHARIAPPIQAKRRALILSGLPSVLRRWFGPEQVCRPLEGVGNTL